MVKRASQRRWLQRQQRDEYVKRAQLDGYRSRAVYKLAEIDERDQVYVRDKWVVDLGAAPGGWSQLAAQWCTGKSEVVALDILPMDAIAGVTFIQGDFCQDAVLQQLLTTLGEHKVGLVLSDMAPNISGISTVDQSRSMYLAELALDLARHVLDQSGNFVAKLFQGEGFDDYARLARADFASVRMRKPKASRSESREVYLVAKGYRGTKS